MTSIHFSWDLMRLEPQQAIIKLGYKIGTFFFFFIIPVCTIIIVIPAMIYLHGLANTIHIYYIINLFSITVVIYRDMLRSNYRVFTTLRVTSVVVMCILIITSLFFSCVLSVCLFCLFCIFHYTILYIIDSTNKNDKEYSSYYRYKIYNIILININLAFINYLKKSIVFLLENPTLLLYIIFRIITFAYFGFEHLWYDNTLENFVFMNATEPSGKGGSSTGNSGHSGGDPGGKSKITWPDSSKGLKRKRDDFEEPNPPMDKYYANTQYEPCTCCGNMGTYYCICGGPRNVPNPYQYTVMGQPLLTPGGQPVFATACTDDYHSRGLPSFGLPCCRCRITVFNYLCTRCSCIYCRSCHYNITSAGSR